MSFSRPYLLWHREPSIMASTEGHVEDTDIEPAKHQSGQVRLCMFQENGSDITVSILRTPIYQDAMRHPVQASQRETSEGRLYFWLLCTEMWSTSRGLWFDIYINILRASNQLSNVEITLLKSDYLWIASQSYWWCSSTCSSGVSSLDWTEKVCFFVGKLDKLGVDGVVRHALGDVD